MVASIVIDERGHVTSGRGIVTASQTSFSDALNFRVRNGGYIEVREFRGGTHIRLNRNSVSPLALMGLLYLLHDRDVTVSVVSFADEGWSGRLYRDRDALCSHISDWLRSSTDNAQWRHIDFQRHILTQETSTIVVKRHLAIWQERLRIADDPRSLAQQLDFAFSGRYTLYRFPRDLSQPLIETVGSVIAAYSQEWARNATGRRLRDAPDPRYGEWVEGHMIGANDRAITFDRVDAIVQWTKTKTARLRYDRAIVPIQRSDGTSLLLGVTQNLAA